MTRTLLLLLLLFCLTNCISSLGDNEIFTISTTIPNLFIASVTIVVLFIVVLCLFKLTCIRRDILRDQSVYLESQRGSRTTDRPEQPVETEIPPAYDIAIEMYDNPRNGEEV